MTAKCGAGPVVDFDDRLALHKEPWVFGGPRLWTRRLFADINM